VRKKSDVNVRKGVKRVMKSDVKKGEELKQDQGLAHQVSEKKCLVCSTLAEKHAAIPYLCIQDCAHLQGWLDPLYAPELFCE
jgi:hypothetical protein